MKLLRKKPKPVEFNSQNGPLANVKQLSDLVQWHVYVLSLYECVCVCVCVCVCAVIFRPRPAIITSF